jgi:hypothetical protein
MKALRLELGTALAADATYLAPAVNGNLIALITAPFTPDENLVIGDLTLADFFGSTPLEAGTGTQDVGIDPPTQEQRITILEPAGGWRWQVTGTTNLPQSVYGFALCTDALASLLAVEALPTPISLTTVGEEINIGSAALTFVLQPMSY